MKEHPTPTLTAISILALMVIHLTGDAIAQQKTLKEQLVGTWTFVSSPSK
jgi:hypothetical protein